MTREQAKELWPIIKAWSEGKEVQFESINGWKDIYNPSFINQVKYRIKPTPSYRPWKPEEVPVGAIIRYKGTNTNRQMILSVIGDEVIMASVNPAECNSFSVSELFNKEHSLNQGKTWLPCGVLVEE